MVCITKLDTADFKNMPWKNGKGLTTELIIEPSHASIAGSFDWRLSMATVKDSGPFSRLIGIDRTILILEGDGIELDHGVCGKNLLTVPLSPVMFQGEWDTFGKLLGGPCLDFNVMTERKKFRHNVAVVHLESTMILQKACTILIFCVNGGAYINSTKEKLSFGELLRVDFEKSNIDTSIELGAADKNTILIVVSIMASKITK